GIGPRATREQVERAYGFFRGMYKEGAVATYSLLDPDAAEEMRARIGEAYDVLKDPVRRREYDVAHGFASPDAPMLPFEAAPREPDETLPSPTRKAPSGPGILPEPVTGADLRRFREEKGVTLGEIASVSKVGVRYLKYIEDDRHSVLPAQVYLRGFVKEYAKAVGLDPDKTAQAYIAGIGKSPE
ncbi:MAG: helix-turn-helix domain-containing protein, partial [Candidatus Deferrimicrobiaceae bacterium]